jgi:D-alanyl-D-alanine carboxypeptidase
MLLLTSLVVVLLGQSVPANEPCRDSVVIDSVAYPLTEQWCGRRLDQAELANRADLVPLPQRLTFQDYRIYVTAATHAAFVKMAAAAAKDTVDLTADSGFRSIGFQSRIIHNRLAAGDSFDHIIHMVAPPGYSQHHTGRALDLVPSEAAFAKTRAYSWLKKNADRFHFHETYPDSPDRRHPWEPWHWAYVPVE